MADSLSLSVRLFVDAARYAAGLARGTADTKRFAASVRHEMATLKQHASSLHGQLAALGLGVGAVQTVRASAGLDRDLIQLRNTAGSTAAEMAQLRDELFANQKATGTLVDTQKELVDTLVAGGMSIEQARGVLGPASETMAVAKTNAHALAAALGVVGQQFKFDLKDPKVAAEVLDKMLVAGRAGHAELENLPDIFAKVGSRARDANLDFTKTLSMIETLSKVEPQTERLGTLVDSTLRVFSNANYMKAASKATGIKFFDAKGTRRDALDVLQDIKAKYDKLHTDAERFKFMSKAFGQTDLDTQKGLRQLLDGDALKDLGKIQDEIANAKGTVSKDLSASLDNAVDQTARLKGALREAADGFAKPINAAISDSIQWAMDSQKLTGEEMIAGGAAAAVGLYGAGRLGSAMAGKLASRFGNVGAGVATGKVLQEAAGVTPVYVVNMPADNLGSKPIPIGPAPAPTVGGAAGMGVAAMLATLAAAVAPLAVMYAATEMAGDTSKDNTRADALKSGSEGLSDTLKRWFGFDKNGEIEARRRKNREELGGDEAEMSRAVADAIRTNAMQGTIAINITGPAAPYAEVTTSNTSSGLKMKVGQTNAGTR